VILVTTGTNGAPFDRLLRAVDSIESDEPVVVQHGPSQIRPAGATCVGYLSFDELVEQIRGARVVITHGGVGSVVVALMHERRPVVVPRLARFGEAVDDHQLAFGRRLRADGLITLVDDVSRLGEALPRSDRHETPAIPSTSRLAGDLGRYLAS